MNDIATTKVSSRAAPTGPEGQVKLVSGARMSMRLWRNEEPTSDKPMRKHDYEVVGFAVSGRAELLIDGKTIALEAGDSWLVPAGSEHTYKILESFTAVETVASPG